MNIDSPVADPSVLYTSTVISVDDGLLRLSTACAGSSFSLTVYADWLNITLITRRLIIFDTQLYISKVIQYILSRDASILPTKLLKYVIENQKQRAGIIGVNSNKICLINYNSYT